MAEYLGFHDKRTGGRVVYCSGLENPAGKPAETTEMAVFCGSPDAHDALFTERSAAGDGTEVGTPQPMRLLVCGGREFDDVPWLWRVLDEINQRRIREHGDGIRCLIDGAQRKRRKDGSIVGADYWAHQWALARGAPTERYPADWDAHGRSAGPKRNRRMRDEGAPTHGLAMPGGNGTAGMVELLHEKHIPVRIEILSTPTTGG